MSIWWLILIFIAVQNRPDDNARTSAWVCWFAVMCGLFFTACVDAYGWPR